MDEARAVLIDAARYGDPVAVTVYTSATYDQVTVFVIEADVADLRWSVRHRFREFVVLDRALRSLHRGLHASAPLVRLPRRHWRVLVDHGDGQFLSARTKGLQDFLQRAVSIAPLLGSEPMLQFLCPPFMARPRRLRQGSAQDEDDELDSCDDPTPEVTGVDIAGVQCLTNGRVVYRVNVCNVAKPDEFRQWTMLKSFSQFFRLSVALRDAFPDVHVARLSKSPMAIVDHLSPSFIQHRMRTLQAFLRELLMDARLATCDETLTFLGVR